MNILYVLNRCLNSLDSDVMQVLEQMGIKAELYPVRQKNGTLLNDEEIEGIVTYIHEHKIDFLMSLHHIYNVALAAYRTGIRYISIIWDAPFVTNYNPLGKLENIWYTTFDKLDRDRFLAYGMPHVLYQPLAVSRQNVMEWNEEVKDVLNGHYIHDISFVGGLYEKNAYDALINEIPKEMQLYFTSIFEEAAFKWDGINRVYGKTGKDILEYMHLLNPQFSLGNRHELDDSRYFEVLFLIRKIANIERIAIFNLLSENYSFALWTTADAEYVKEKLPNIEMHPPVLAGKAASVIYAGSKINLHIALKGIEGGTSQRVMDIMGAGGFVLSSYCTETAELFEEDKEIVMYRSPEELVEKVEYYLEHDEERKQIAKAGYEKVISCYTYEKKLVELMKWVGASI